MWFDEIMDDCKEALRISSQNKGIFAPIFINLGIGILSFIFIFAAIMIFVISLTGYSNRGLDSLDIFMRNLPLLIILVIVFYLISVVVSSIVEAGSINLLKTAASGIKPRSGDFFQGIKFFFAKIFGGKLLIHSIILLASPIIIALFILYAALVGTLTAGWGITFLVILITVFLSTWTTIIVIENIGPVKAMGIGFKLGRRYFPGLFIISLSYLLINQYLVSSLGIWVALLGSWFISGVITIYFKLVYLLIYKRKRNEFM